MSSNTEETWRKKLSSEQYRVLREKATEAPFTGDLLHNEKTGMYTCAGCGAELFSSDHKFDSGTGWPSFYDVVSLDTVEPKEDTTHGIQRTEVVCRNCGGHLGHLFDDAPHQPTGKRYCINSIALAFEPKDTPDE
ncbi:peptide-methionine (R)-S-oxide reductase MsrB [soil metagenome]